MKFDIYCDESCQEAFKDKPAHKFVGIGGIKIPTENRAQFKSEIATIKNRFACHSEIKWNKVSPNKESYYKELINFFFSHDWIRFKIILIESDKVDLVKYHDGDGELGYYKFYYQMLNKWISDHNEYSIFLDHKSNRQRDRLPVLRQCLSHSNIFSSVGNVQAIPSDESVGIQLADLLIGATLGKFNQEHTSNTKSELIEKIELYLGTRLAPTPPSQEKFNIFQINLGGGW